MFFDEKKIKRLRRLIKPLSGKEISDWQLLNPSSLLTKEYPFHSIVKYQSDYFWTTKIIQLELKLEYWEIGNFYKFYWCWNFKQFNGKLTIFCGNCMKFWMEIVFLSISSRRKTSLNFCTTMMEIIVENV